MAEPLVIILAQQFRQLLLERDQAAVREMTLRWLEVEKALEGQILSLAETLTAEKEAGRSISQSKLYRLRRYQRLLAQTQAEMAKYNAKAEVLIDQAAVDSAITGLQDSLALLEATASSTGPVDIVFDRLGVEAAQNIAAIARRRHCLRYCRRRWVHSALPRPRCR